MVAQSFQLSAFSYSATASNRTMSTSAKGPILR
jgi:hypothetical protein